MRLQVETRLARYVRINLSPKADKTANSICYKGKASEAAGQGRFGTRSVQGIPHLCLSKSIPSAPTVWSVIDFKNEDLHDRGALKDLDLVVGGGWGVGV